MSSGEAEYQPDSISSCALIHGADKLETSLVRDLLRFQSVIISYFTASVGHHAVEYHQVSFEGRMFRLEYPIQVQESTMRYKPTVRLQSMG